MRVKELIGHLMRVEQLEGDLLVLMGHPDHEGTAFELGKVGVRGIERNADGSTKTKGLMLFPNSSAHAQGPGLILPTTRKDN